MKDQLLSDKLKAHLKIECDWEFDSEDKRIMVYNTTSWGAETKEDYERYESVISEFSLSGDGWKLHGSYDVSGYDYWMINMKEQNYASIDVYLDKDDYSEFEIQRIAAAIIDAEIYFEENLGTHDPWEDDTKFDRQEEF